jgi:hypothetical protein
MDNDIDGFQLRGLFVGGQENPSAEDPLGGTAAPQYPTTTTSESRQRLQDQACKAFTETVERLASHMTTELREEIEPKQFYVQELEKRVESLERENRTLRGMGACRDGEEAPISTTTGKRRKLSSKEFEHFFPGFERHVGFLNEAFDGPDGERAVMDLLQSKPEILKLRNFERWCFRRGLEDLYRKLGVSPPDSVRVPGNGRTSDDEWDFDFD